MSHETEDSNSPCEQQLSKADDALLDQQRKDALLEQERMRKWIEEDEPLPVKMSCKLRQHIVAKENQ